MTKPDKNTLGDSPEARAQYKANNPYNSGHVPDVAEISAKDCNGHDRLWETKVVNVHRFSTQDKGLGSSCGGGKPACNKGHLFGFGNSEEKLRWENFGCSSIGSPSQDAFDHDTGVGYVKEKTGKYHDAISVKKSVLRMILVEDMGGVAPASCAAIWRLAHNTAKLNRGFKAIHFYTKWLARIAHAAIQGDAQNMCEKVRNQKKEWFLFHLPANTT